MSGAPNILFEFRGAGTVSVDYFDSRKHSTRAFVQRETT